ncbi:uncharacterized protein LOC118274828 [Spodoptera frugiperda]|uniref:Uncharacterized protein LOC118274828 n=1 Tax=Spodoptera frugiperda TaxID=7108 RepID=A0A9R0DCX2_SPOFR|nr:uncharacterized protein LOC118274828 [Spodoptera frugiperda]
MVSLSLCTLEQANMLRVVAYVCALLALAHGQTTNVQSCSNNAPLPIHAYIEGCVEPPCVFQPGTYVVVNVVFRAPRRIQSMTTHATTVFLWPSPFILGEAAHTCNYLTNSQCPLDKGEVVQYTLHMFIETFILGSTQVPAEFRVTEGPGATDPTLWCFSVPVIFGRRSQF